MLVKMRKVHGVDTAWGVIVIDDCYGDRIRL